MQRSRIKKFKFLKDFCVISGIIGFLIIATTPDNMQMDLFIIRLLIGTSVFVLSFFTHRFVSGYEKYIEYNSRKQ